MAVPQLYKDLALGLGGSLLVGILGVGVIMDHHQDKVAKEEMEEKVYACKHGVHS